MHLETHSKVYTFAIKSVLEIIPLEVLCHYSAYWCFLGRFDFEKSACP